jgi:hypothetical protein
MNMQYYNNYGNNKNIFINNKESNNIFSFNNKFLLRNTQNNSLLNISKQIVNNNDNDNDNVLKNEESLENTRLRWGPSTWFLFHTLAEKIKEEKFMDLKDELLDIIKGLCMNLPCPTCSSHATEYIKKLNYISIKNKNDLKIFLFNFHNDVNIRNNINHFSLDELNYKYSKSNTLNIINNFISVYQYKNRSFNMISNEIQRQRQLEIFKSWIKQNIQYFSL